MKNIEKYKVQILKLIGEKRFDASLNLTFNYYKHTDEKNRLFLLKHIKLFSSLLIEPKSIKFNFDKNEVRSCSFCCNTLNLTLGHSGAICNSCVNKINNLKS